jgi:DNA polymerase-1
VPLEFDLARMKRQAIDYDAARELFLELEFSGLLKQLAPNGPENTPESPSPQVEKPAAKYRTIKTMAELKDVIQKLSGCKEIAIDTETTSLNALEADLVGVSLCAEAGEAYYVPLGHSLDEQNNLPFDSAVKLLKGLLENPKVAKFGQNMKYDLHVLRRGGIEVAPISFDTMLASYVADPSSREHGLDFLARKHFDYEMQPISALIGSGKKQTTFDMVPVSQAGFYAAEDADYTFRLRDVFAPEIERLKLDDLFYNVEIPLITVLADMEQDGIRVDTEFLAGLSLEMETKLDGLRTEIYKAAGEEFNINSTQQLSHILFDQLGLPTKGKTAKKTGYSTDVRVLEELSRSHPFPQLILDYRQFTKLKSTYVDAIPKLVSPATGRVHTSFNQAVAATGRLSSTDPNLQNIPIRTPEGRQIRKAFVARDDDHVLLVADYSQVELRILAHYSEDESLTKAFVTGDDIHARTAAEVYGVELADVTGEQRRAAKTANFAIIYGVSAYGLAQQTELDLTGAKSFIDTYFERYPGIKNYIESTKQLAREQGFVTTLMNRIRYLPEINSKNFNVRQFAERTAINTPIQGTAADMIKVAMITVHDQLAGMKSRMVLQVHDELVLDVHRSELEKVREIVKSGMEQALELRVPVTVDMGVGTNWLEAK